MPTACPYDAPHRACRPPAAPHPKHAKESACGCAGLFSAPVALALYAHAFEQAGALQHFEAFASFNGPDFYGLPRNAGEGQAACRVPTEQRAARGAPHAALPPDPAARPRHPPTPPLCLCLPPGTHLSADKVTLRRQPWTVPASYAFGDSEVVPMWAGQECPWTVVA